ncbi:MAG: hypothetical protein IPK18_01350 [Sphingobacteriales bacterium]|jgi:hypothetical protein|nr:MAG: hypothetical protein IPK18_01350 [Sphingobacteriales bacterium]
MNKIWKYTFAVVGWIDVFTRVIYRDIIVESLKYCQVEKGLNLYAMHSQVTQLRYGFALLNLRELGYARIINMCKS